MVVLEARHRRLEVEVVRTVIASEYAHQGLEQEYPLHGKSESVSAVATVHNSSNTPDTVL